jgi:type II secretory ATPase GspE/PulE/Tfp pilus assembly ATPase PilB-like protein
MPDTINRFRALIRSPNGVIAMTGPTGSGKTTTLYSALSTINNIDTKIVTIEDPVEYMLDGINQVQINKEVGLDFALGLRSILRQSPDVIMVGEMRDLETAEIGIRAALTGHLVFSTLHTNDAPSACVRLTDMGVKPFMVASALQAVIAQRLVRRICGACKQEVPARKEEIELMELPWEDWMDTSFYAGKGCDRCNQTGYRGRTAIHEVFTMNPTLRQMVIRMESGSKLKKAALAAGMRSLRMDGWEKVLLGQTTIPEIARITVEDAGGH